jgi:AraC-like DNA-binding protein
MEQVVVDVGWRGGYGPLESAAVPAQRATSALVARGVAALCDEQSAAWNELALDVAATSLSAEPVGMRAPNPLAIGRVTAVVRHIEDSAGSDATLSLEELAAMAGLSPFHFLRTFRAVTGETPHRYVRRARLRDAAVRLLAEPSRIIDVSLDAGFADLSTFNRAFREEFGMPPHRFRRDLR